MTTRIKLRRDTATNWQLANPILAAGEPGLETDTGKIKYGDGITAYSDLPHAGDQLTANKALTITSGDDSKWIALQKRDAFWDNNGSDGISNISVTYDRVGNIVTAGVIDQNGLLNFYVSKYTPAGVCLWKKVLVAVIPSMYVYLEGGLAIDSVNNIILSFGFDGPGFSLIKLDSNGESVWCRQYTDNVGSAVVTSIAVDSHDDIFITTFEADSTGIFGIHKVARSTGDVIWTNQFADVATWQYGASVAIDYQDNILLCGGQQGASQDLTVVAKLDSTGALLWKKTLSMPDAAVDYTSAYPNGIDVDAMGNAYITGSYMVQSPLSDTNNAGQRSMAVFIVKLNASGAIQWSRRAGPGPCDWTGLSTTIGDDGDLYLAAATTTTTQAQLGGATTENVNFEKGFYEHNLVLARYSAGNGDVVWQKYFNNRHEQIGANNNGPVAPSRSIDVYGDKLVICGSSQLAFDNGNGWNTDNWFTGWVAQLSTDGSEGFDLADFKFVDSRVPGKKIRILATDNTTLTFGPGTLVDNGNENGIPMEDAPISTTVIKSKSNTWTFDSQGTVHTPVEGNIVLDQTELGYANFIGYEHNNNDDIWFQSVVGDADGNTYALGANYWNQRKVNVYKFDPVGTLAWAVELRSGSGSVWYVSWDAGVYTITDLLYQGENYRVGDTVIISGGSFGGDSPTNDLTILVTEVDNGQRGQAGNITGYEIQSGVAPAGTDSVVGVNDNNDDGRSRPQAITIDPVTGNLNIIADTYEYVGNTSLLHLVLDAESGACLANTEIHSTGKDVYGYDVQVSATGVPAIVGQQYGDLKDVVTVSAEGASKLGNIIMGKEAILNADDGRYPGYSSGSDWYVSGTGITNRAEIGEFNQYRYLTTTVRQGDGLATFTITSSGGTYTSATTVVAGGANYLVGHKLKVLGSALGGVDGVNDAILQVISVDSGVITQADVISGVAVSGSPTTATFNINTDYSSWSFNTAQGLFDIFSPSVSGALLPVLQSGVPSGTTITIPANGPDAERVFVLTSSIAYDPNAGGGSGAWHATFTQTSGSSFSGNPFHVVVNIPGASGSGTAVSAGNYQVGSGLTVQINFDPVDGSYWYININTNGDNYTVGDRVTVAGTQFAGCTSPANDIVFTVWSVSGGTSAGNRGAAYNFTDFTAPSINTEYLSMIVYGYDNLDFTGTGSWTLLESLDGQAFVRTPDFQKTFGGNANDWFYTSAWQGTDLYVAGGSHNTTSNEDENVLIKLSATGEVLWKKQITHPDYQGYSEVFSIGTHADGVVAVGQVEDWDTERYVLLMYKLDNDGGLMWHKNIDFVDDSNPYTSTMAVDPATGDIIVLTSAYNNDIDADILYINKFDKDGNIIWKRRLYTGGGDYFLWDNGFRALSIAGGKFCIAGYTYWQTDYDSNAYSMSLPLDGTGTGELGVWTYDANVDANVKTYDKLSGDTVVVTHPIEDHVSTDLAINNARFYYTDFPNWTFPILNYIVRNKSGGAIVFPDGSKQTTSAGVSQQVRMGQQYYINIDDANGHVFIDDNNTWNTHYVYIPYWEAEKLPVGFKFSIVNRSDNTVYVELNSGFGPDGSIYGVNGYGNFENYKTWYIGGNNNGAQWVELMKVKEGFKVGDNWQGDQWVIRGPGGSGDFGAD